MPDLQLKDGNWLQIRKEILEALARYKLSEHERAVLDLVIRLCYGCKSNEEDGRYCFYDSKRQFASACGLYPNALDAAWKSLVEYRILYIDERHKVIVFNKDYDTWKAALKPAFKTESLSKIKARNFPVGNLDLAVGNQAYTTMKLCYRFGYNISDSDTLYPNRVHNNISDLDTMCPNQCIQNGQSISESDKYDISESDISTEPKPNNDKPSQPPKDIKDNIYIYTDLLEKLEFLPGIIDISRDSDKEYFEYIKTFEGEKIDTVLAEAQRRTKLKSGDKDKLQRKSVLKFVAGGLENYELLYANKKPTKKLTPKERAVAQGIKIIQAYQAHPDMIQSKRQLSSLSKYYEQYEDYGELVNMTLEQVNQAIGEE